MSLEGFAAAYSCSAATVRWPCTRQEPASELLGLRSGPGLRIAVEIGSGLLAVGLATGVGVGVSQATCSDCSFANLEGALLGFGAGLALAPLAVWGGGQLVDGRSHLGGAYLGALAGYGLAAGALAGASSLDSDTAGFQLIFLTDSRVEAELGLRSPCSSP